MCSHVCQACNGRIRLSSMMAGNIPLLLCWPALALFSILSLSIEKLGAARLVAERKVCVSSALLVLPYQNQDV